LAFLKDPPLTLLAELSTDMLKKKGLEEDKNEIRSDLQRTKNSKINKGKKIYEICEGKMRLESQVDDTM
jgi:hypothetical protein